MSVLHKEMLDNYTIGFGPLFTQLAEICLQSSNNYPPHNIAKIDENNFKLVFAVAGWAKSELTVKFAEGMLRVAGKKHDFPKNNKDIIYRGIAERDFYKRFRLGEHIEVVDSELADGILTVNLKRELPENKQPKTIAIN
jgi:molecular chaperone IbpA